MRQVRTSALLDAYLERREALIRYLTARSGSRVQAEDLVQDVYLKIGVMSDADVAQVLNPNAFLYRLATNIFLDRIKQEHRGQRRQSDWRAAHVSVVGADDISQDPPADDAAWARQKLDRVVAALELLSPNCRRAFRLHKLEGLSHAETAQAMGISKSAVEKHISTALKRLLIEVGWP